MDRLDFLQNEFLKKIKKIDNESFRRYQKTSNNLQIKKSIFFGKINKTEENIVSESEDKDADLLLKNI